MGVQGFWIQISNRPGIQDSNFKKGKILDSDFKMGQIQNSTFWDSYFKMAGILDSGFKFQMDGIQDSDLGFHGPNNVGPILDFDPERPINTQAFPFCTCFRRIRPHLMSSINSLNMDRGKLTTKFKCFHVLKTNVNAKQMI